MNYSTLLAGSLDVVRSCLDDQIMGPLGPRADVVVLPTAAAFTGAAQAAVAVAAALEGSDTIMEALMVTDRPSADEPHFARRIAEAQLVVLCDGSPLHARAVWRSTLVGEAIRGATRLVAIGAVASTLFEVMIDPRGGAPTTGLGYRTGLIACAPESDDQLTRTRSLLDASATLCVVGSNGAVAFDGVKWHSVGDDLVVTRGTQRVTL